MARSTQDAPAGTAASELSGPAQHGLALYRRMRLIRRFEESVQSLFQKGEVHGTTHLYVGEEAGAVGVGDVLGEHDRVAGTYRGHGHALAVGVDPQALLDEMLGRSTGVCGGRAGSMNVIDLVAPADRLVRDHRRLDLRRDRRGTRAQTQGRGGVAVAFFGDGHDEPRLLPRVPQLRGGADDCRSSSSARTTATASSRRSRTSPPARSPRAPQTLEIPTEHGRRDGRLGRARGR